MLQVAILLPPLLDGADPEGAFLGIGAGHGLDDRQGQLALAEIVADVLAGGLGVALHVEQVIDDLEGDAQRVAIVEHRAHMILGRARQHRARLGRGGKQRRGLAANDLEVDALVRAQVLRGGQLQHLALGDGRGGIGQDRQHAQAARLDHQLKGAGKEVIAHQHAGLVVPQQVRRGPPAALGAFVHHVVMQERCRVDEFHRRGQMHRIGPVVAAQLGCGQHQHRAQALAARFDQMRGDLGYARGVFAGHALADQHVHRGHAPCQMGGQFLVRLACAVIQTHAPPRCRFSSRGQGPTLRRMKQLLRTTDPTVIAFAQALLQGEDIDCFELDVNMSVLDGSIGILPRRLMVREADFFIARAVLRDNGIAVE